MFSKVIVAVCFIVAALARPDKPPQQGYQYQPPQPTYDPPKPTYSAPSKPEPTYSAPRVPEPTYSAPSVPEPTYSAPKEEEMPPMPFQYGYEVRDEEHGVDFSHNTDSDGPSTTGEYRVALPDGRTQIVKYTVSSEGGYVAEVTYEGEARPYVPPAKSDSSEESYNYQPPQQPQPAYNAPEPAYQAPEPPQRTYGANF